jgi:hypothetical protein
MKDDEVHDGCSLICYNKHLRYHHWLPTVTYGLPFT